MIPSKISGLLRIWRLRKSGTYLLWSLALALLGWNLVDHFIFSLPFFWVPISAGLFAVTLYYMTGVPFTGPPDLCQYLNRNYPVLEDSADLFLRDEATLPGISRLQRQKIERRLEELAITLPPSLFPGSVACLLACFFSWGLREFPRPTEQVNLPVFTTLAISDSTGVLRSEEPPQLTKLRIQIQAPDYTRLAENTSTQPDLTVAWGSTVTWQLEFSREISEGSISLGNGQNLRMQKKDGLRYIARRQFFESGFYTIRYRGESGAWQISDFFRVEITPDQAPAILVTGLNEYSVVSLDGNRRLSFNVQLNDDFGIGQARMIATVSKGEGESIKFRDDTLSFAQSFHQRLTQYQLQPILQLDQLGMEPGDELYLHIETIDNRNPGPQLSKTPKFIISLEDTARVELAMFGGLAIDRLPEYFRSQRQIIIDTEKLIARRTELAAERFQELSNNIAIDQKVLRLRYGKFLGEEFTAAIGEVSSLPAEDPDHDHAGHEHEEEAADEHEHHDPDGGPNLTLSPEDKEIKELEPYMHLHDIEEEATFYDAATSSKLRVALAEMWDAELHLRLGDPEQALPYEYRALKLIKEIQQASRIYVARVGFEPPVIKVAEKRLSGELEEIRPAVFQTNRPAAPPFPALQKSFPILEKLRQDNRKPNDQEKNLLQSAGEEIAALALESPGRYLVNLQQLRAVMDEALPSDRRQFYLQSLIRLCWQLLPGEQELPLRPVRNGTRLRDLFLAETGPE